MQTIDMVDFKRYIFFSKNCFICYKCFEIFYSPLGFAGDDHSYLKNPIWWLGMATSRFIDYIIFKNRNNI